MREFPLHAHIPRPPRQFAEVDRQCAPLWDPPQLATSNQHRKGLTINEQVSLKLSVRLQRFQGKPRHPKTRPKLAKALQLQSAKTLFLIRSQKR